jgi:hypothetical protein
LKALSLADLQHPQRDLLPSVHAGKLAIEG